MEGLPSGDIQAKYQKLAAEYSKLRVHVKVLKKGVLDEQAKSNELRELLKEKEKSLRKGELEIDSLTFRNQQLTRRVSVLQDEIEQTQTKLTKKSKSKDDKAPSNSNPAPLDAGLLQEELQKKIIENAQYASQLSDKTFEVSQLQASIEDCNRHMSECESRYKCEIAKLKNKNQELQFALEEAQKERLGSTPKIGSEDALSSVDDLHINEQLSNKLHNSEQENQKLRMEYGMLQLENESLKLEISKHVSASQRRRGDTHDSGDFNTFSETSIDGEGKITGLLGSLQVPFLLSGEVQEREERMLSYFRNKISALSAERDELISNAEHYVKECEMLRLRFEELQQEKETDANTIQDKHDTIARLEEELHSTSHNYEQQMSVLTEHVAALNDRLAAQHDQLLQLRHQLATRKK
ncbi:protein phosphatase 1 regulatory subunit 21 isoform X2 [Zerene cesonia]|uniref:protein phosphatase 1 regulatory subunit 21 isoform X2 n=1 Tax=Zerene cesonia TaxID=33412 RepID=UPI0018E51766|nr:protein phosphatase 1 regulatory subunit 21 isoform X2 [Zerene cesonia]